MLRCFSAIWMSRVGVLSSTHYLYWRHLFELIICIKTSVHSFKQSDYNLYTKTKKLSKDTKDCTPEQAAW